MNEHHTFADALYMLINQLPVIISAIFAGWAATRAHTAATKADEAVNIGRANKELIVTGNELTATGNEVAEQVKKQTNGQFEQLRKDLALANEQREAAMKDNVSLRADVEHHNRRWNDAKKQSEVVIQEENARGDG